MIRTESQSGFFIIEIRIQNRDARMLCHGIPQPFKLPVVDGHCIGSGAPDPLGQKTRIRMGSPRQFGNQLCTAAMFLLLVAQLVAVSGMTMMLR